MLNTLILLAKYETPRPEVFFNNYDYGQQSKSEKENTKLGPGTGFYENMDKYKSTKDFINSDRKMKRKQRKKKLASLLDLTDIPKDVLHEKTETEMENEISKDNTINGIPFTNRVDPYPTYDSSLAAPVGNVFDNNVNQNSYYGLISLQGSNLSKTLKLAELYHNLSKNK